MKIGLYDVDSHNFPNLALMKISAWHKSKGDTVEWWCPILHFDKVYVSKIFGDEYSQLSQFCINADEVIYGGTGFAITIENGVEVFHKNRDKDLPYEIEHMYPDYDLYPQYTKDTAYGFLTRGCPNNCSFCSVSKKEGRESHKVADLKEFWNGQKNIKLLDPNILACKDRLELLEQLAESKAKVDFTQGLDARFLTEEICNLLKRIRIKSVHFAFDLMKHEKAIIKGLKMYSSIVGTTHNDIVYMLTNFDTTHEQDMYRLRAIEQCGFYPDVRVYRKNTAPQITRDLQGWCNNRIIYKSCKWEDFVPRKDGKTIKQLYYEV